jgi:hypothetical protein
MSMETTTPNQQAAPGRPWLLGLLALVLFGLIGTGVAYFGIQEGPGISPGPKKPEKKVAGSITRIELPAEDTPIPAGPHRDEFRAACTVCHSARLVFTQPHLSDGQWSKVVQKMTGKFGAPLSADDEKRIVHYLHAVHGK